MSGKGWIMVLLAVVVITTALILTGHVERWSDSDLRDLWFPAFGLLIVGAIVWYFRRTPRGGGK
jgi:hypothetical protein